MGAASEMNLICSRGTRSLRCGERLMGICVGILEAQTLKFLFHHSALAWAPSTPSTA